MIFNTRRTLLGFKPGTNEEVLVEYPGNVEQVLSHLDEVIDRYRYRQEGDEFSIHDAEILNTLREARTAIGRAVDFRDAAESVDPIDDLTDDEADRLIDAINSDLAQRDCANVLVHRGMPPAANPYRGFAGRGRHDDPYTHVDGDERVAALHAFNTGEPPAEYTYWWAPACGGAYQLDPAIHRIRGLR